MTEVAEGASGRRAPWTRAVMLLAILAAAAPVVVAQPATTARSAQVTPGRPLTFVSTDDRLQITTPPDWAHPAAPPEVAVFMLRGPVREGMQGPPAFVMKAIVEETDNAAAPRRALVDVATDELTRVIRDKPQTVKLEETTVDGAEAYRFAVERTSRVHGALRSLAVVTRKDGRTYIGQYTARVEDFDADEAAALIASLRWVDEPPPASTTRPAGQE